MLSEAQAIRMIWITPRFPIGIPDGARIATSSLIHQLTQRGVEIDLICLLADGESGEEALARQELGVRSCQFIRRNQSKFFPLASLRLPFTFRSFARRSVQKALEEHVLNRLAHSEAGVKNYIVFDGLHTAAALRSDLSEWSKRCNGLIYRAHNVETVLWEQCAQKATAPWLRWFFRYQAGLVRQFESYVARHVQMVAPVSEEDGKRFEELTSSAARVSVTRIGIEFPSLPSTPTAHKSRLFQILFLGRLDWLPNRTGLDWFLSQVWPSIAECRPEARLTIAGRGDRRWLERHLHFSNIHVLGEVNEVEPLYESATLCIAPLFQGSGMRVKILEAAGFSKPVLTTALGAEGTGLVPGLSYLRAETSDEWRQALSSMTSEECERIGANAYRYARERFDGEAIATGLIRSLGALGIPS